MCPEKPQSRAQSLPCEVLRKSPAAPGNRAPPPMKFRCLPFGKQNQCPQATESKTTAPGFLFQSAVKSPEAKPLFQWEINGAARQFLESHALVNSNEKSIERTECVSSPTEMKSTPVSAIARTDCKEPPPLASNLMPGFFNDTQARSSFGDMLSSRMTSMPAMPTNARTWSMESASSSTRIPGCVSRSASTVF